MKHLISTEALDKSELESLFALADEIKKNPKKYSKALDGKLVATVFYEPSTRTRCSFESAIMRLGGGVISTENARENASVNKGESLEDTIKILMGYVDAIVIRHFENDSSERAVAVSSVPIINAGSGSSQHPTQAILDVYTIREIKGTLDGISIAIMGDLKYGRTANSAVRLLSLYKDIKVYGFSPKGLELEQKYIEFLENRGIKYIAVDRFEDIPSDIDVIYQTRVQRERLPDKSVCVEEFSITKETLKKLSADTLIMHPLPRNNEISADVDDDPRAVYFRQAHNGIPTRMAVLLTVLGK